jgi:plasmid stabilization system protein ParE
MIRVRLSEEALRDIQEGYAFYEAQDAGLGNYFVDCVRTDVEALRITAGTHRLVYRDYHRALSRVFPCGIFYTHEKDDVVVWAVVDLRRDPKWIRKHLGI